MILPLCPDLVSTEEIQDKISVGMFGDVCEHMQRLGKLYITVNPYRVGKSSIF